MNDNPVKTVNDWLMQQRVQDFGLLAFTTTPAQRAKAAAEMFHKALAMK
jgi:hypothetical protein